MHVPIDVHLVAVKWILRYLCDTIDYGLQIQSFERLVGLTDANWDLDFDDRRSTTGYCVHFGGNPISWCFKLPLDRQLNQNIEAQQLLLQTLHGLSPCRVNFT